MGRFLAEPTTIKIHEQMFCGFDNSPAEVMLINELSRYIPEMVGESDEVIEAFVEYQRGIYIDGELPVIGRAIASLNPTFIDDLRQIKLSEPGMEIYTRASVKENGYRFQAHVAPKKTCAFTRQFTSYDLRMFPELTATLKKLPVMIGDAELINKKYPHLAGFNRVQIRIPGVSYWPRWGTDQLEDKAIEEYLANPKIFTKGMPSEDLEMTLAFHGMFAIADPSTWHLSKTQQLKKLISLSQLPIDYAGIDEILNQLADFLAEKKLNARVVTREVMHDKKQLEEYVAEKYAQNLEGACVVQSSWSSRDGLPSFAVGKSFKLKNYETVDAILMGLYLKEKAVGIVPENIVGGLMGLFDNSLGMYLPAFRVNFDPTGPQIKTVGQRERLTSLREELIKVIKIGSNEPIPTLYDAFMRQGEIKLRFAFGQQRDEDINEILSELPRGSNFIELYKQYADDPKRWEGEIKKPKVAEKFLQKYRDFFQALSEIDISTLKEILVYFLRVGEIKKYSAKMIKPQVVLDLSHPVILEAQVFDIKWNKNPYPAGFHTKYGDSFHLSNAFAERIREDKKSTTDYETIYILARRYTAKK